MIRLDGLALALFKKDSQELCLVDYTCSCLFRARNTTDLNEVSNENILVTWWSTAVRFFAIVTEKIGHRKYQ